MKMEMTKLIPCIATTLLLLAAKIFPTSAHSEHSLVDLAIDNGYSTFVSSAISSGFLDILTGFNDPLTWFTPTNEAFDELPAGVFDYLLADQEKLAHVVGFHTVVGNISSSDLSDQQRLTTITDEKLTITVTSESILVEDAAIIDADLFAADGVIHGINQVLLPPDLDFPNNIVENAMQEEDLTIFVAAASASGFTDTLIGNILTVFAPVDSAFDALPAGALTYLLGDNETLTSLLEYHAAAGILMSTDLSDGLEITVLDDNILTVGIELLDIMKATVTINGTSNGATIIEADIECLNGVLHKIDEVLIPPGFTLPNNIVQTLEADGRFTTLAAAIDAVGLTDALASSIFTMFAPTDDAFDGLPAGGLQYLLDNPDMLTDVLLYHLVDGLRLAGTLEDAEEIETVEGDEVKIAVAGGSITVNGATVIEGDILALNGVIHAIDQVLLPPGFEFPPNLVEVASKEDDLTIMVYAAAAANLTDDLEDNVLTVFTPTDAAFQALPAGALDYLLGAPTDLATVLVYHASPGVIMSNDLLDDTTLTALDGNTLTVGRNQSGIFINDATVVQADIAALNGIIHKIDEVLFPPDYALPNNIVEALAADGRFNTLVAAIDGAGLSDALASAIFTMFSPTDDAFAALPAGGLDYLVANIDILTGVLLYHVADGELPSEDLQNGDKIETIGGDDVTIQRAGETITVNDAVILEADIPALNGVIHAIDEVLLPPGFEFPPNLVEVARQEDDLTIFVASATVLFPDDLVNMILTIFAPIDDAFNSLPAGALDHLLGNPTDMTTVLAYHLASGVIKSTDLSDGTAIIALDDNELTVAVNRTSIFINNEALVVDADIMALNGVIHKIDSVLFPPGYALPSNIVETLASFSIFSILLTAIESVGLADALVSDIFTLFAPTNDAFDALPGGGLMYLLDNPDILTEVLLYHVTEGSRPASTLQDGDKIETVSGGKLEIQAAGGTIVVGGANVVEDDIMALNGVIHAIDQVLLPPGFEFPPSLTQVVAGEDDLTILTAAAMSVLPEGDLDSLILTIFAPIDAAFEALPAGGLDYLLGNLEDLSIVISYHVAMGVALSTGLTDGMTIPAIDGNELTVGVNGTSITINEADVVEADIVALNGVIHKIDEVLFPPGYSLPNNIVQTLEADGRFNTLVDAVTAAGLSETLVAYIFTMFAPTDDAFAALPAGGLEYFLANIDILSDVLLYHVTAGSRLSETFEDDEDIDTISGDKVTMMVAGPSITVNGVLIAEADVTALNGVIHVIDEVLLPPGFEFPPNLFDVASQQDDLSIFMDAALSVLPDDFDLASLILTIFAPIDEAFESLPAGALDYLLETPTDLVVILTYHIAPGYLVSRDFIDVIDIFGDAVVEVLDGNELTLTVNETAIIINNEAEIVEADIIALNGAIHKIDDVLFPPGYSLPNNIMETLEADGRFTTLVLAINTAGLSEALVSDIFTMFAPTDTAFDSLTGGQLEYVLDNPDILVDVLLYHVAEGLIGSNDLVDNEEIEMLNGEEVEVQVAGGSITINGVDVIEANITALNGFIHAIDDILVPPDVTIPPGIVDIVETTDDLSTLESLLTATDLYVALKEPGPFTLFAPNNAAWAQIPQATLDSWLAEEGLGTLTGILSYHVLPTVVTTTNIENGLMIAQTIQGESLEFTPPDMVNTATIVAGDIEAVNGMVHIIDEVLIPP